MRFIFTIILCFKNVNNKINIKLILITFPKKMTCLQSYIILINVKRLVLLRRSSELLFDKQIEFVCVRVIWTYNSCTCTHFMEGRWRRTTSTAWTGLVLIGLSSSRGSGILRPVSTSCNRCQLTRDTNLIVTLKGLSLPPSPGSVTSRSTCRHITRTDAV